MREEKRGGVKFTIVPCTLILQGSSHAALRSITIDLPSASYHHRLPLCNARRQDCSEGYTPMLTLNPLTR